MTRLLWVVAALFLLGGVGALAAGAGYGEEAAGALIGLLAGVIPLAVAALVARFSGRKGRVEP